MNKIINKQTSKVLSGKSKKPPTPTKKEMQQAGIIEKILEIYDNDSSDMAKIININRNVPGLKLIEKMKKMLDYSRKNFTHNKTEVEYIKTLILKQAKDYAENKKNTKIYKKYIDYNDYKESIEKPNLYALKKSIRSRKMSG